MKFLKRKIQLCKHSAKLLHDVIEEDNIRSEDQVKSVEKAKPVNETKILKRNRISGKPQSNHNSRSIKNMAKNYGRAICNFGLSHVSASYLQQIEKNSENLSKFRLHLLKNKESIDGIDTFRSMMLIKEDDDNEQKMFKAIFQKLGVIFMKFFSVNWIYEGKVTYKSEYLRYRFKILRRIKRPELFTYIK